MTTEVRNTSIPLPSKSRFQWRETVFTVEDARRALPYVSRVVADASQAFRRIADLRSNQPVDPAQRQALDLEIADALRRLNRAIDECNAAGVHLSDIEAGEVRFTAEVAGERTSLVWRIGEDVTGAWATLVEGTSAETLSRQPTRAAQKARQPCPVRR